MNPVFNAALELQSVCRNQEWQFCSELAPLLELKGEPENMGRLEKVIARHTLKLPEP